MSEPTTSTIDRSRQARPRHGLADLLTFPWIGPVLRSAWTWRLLRLAALALLVVMAAYGWHHHAIPGVGVPDPLMYTNLATYLFWVIWMMGVVFLALVAGRAWCAVCPLGWLNGLAARFGLKRELPSWLRTFLPVTLVLVALQLAVYLLAIHRFPDYTAALLALMLLLALGCGLLFRGHAFCSLLCPAGAVFGLYARFAPFQLRVADPGVCASCESRDCISGTTSWKRLHLGPAQLTWPSRRPDCPVDLVPAEIDESSTCTLCLNCVRNCEKGNILVGRRPWLGDLGKSGLPPTETVFFLVLLGLVTVNFSKVFVTLREILLWVPDQAARVLGWQETGFYLLATPWVALVLPLLLMLPGYLVLQFGRWRLETLPSGEEWTSLRTSSTDTDPGVWATLGRLALPLIPLVLAAHLVLAVVKLNAKGGYLPLVLEDPTGVRSYLAMNIMQTLTPPSGLVPLDLLKWVVLALVGVGYLLSLAAALKAGRGLYGPRGSRLFTAAAATGATLLTFLYGATVIRWLFIR